MYVSADNDIRNSNVANMIHMLIVLIALRADVAYYKQIHSSMLLIKN